jgi:hypothetical protein
MALGDNASMMDAIRFCWKTQALGINGFNSSTKWMDDCADSLMLFIAFLVLVGIVAILLGLRMCTMCAKRCKADNEQSEAQSKKDE